MTVRQAVVLVGGRGTRLGALAASTPKPLLPIEGDMRFLDIALRNVARQGFTEIVLLAGHLGEQVVARYDGRRLLGSTLRVFVEHQPLGTAGALLNAQHALAERFVMLNGDCLFDINIRALVAAASEGRSIATLALRRVEDARRYGSVAVDGNRIEAFREKNAELAGPALINGGIYVIDKRILGLIERTPCSLEQDIFPKLARDGDLYGFEHQGYFLDIGLPETLEQGRRELIATMRRPAAFLDRDGVLNIDHGYVHRPEQVEWVAGARNAVRRLNDAGYYVFVVTNQAGIAHGYYDHDTMHVLHTWMSDQLAKVGAFWDDLYWCPFHPDGKVDAYRGHHPDRKPNAGMIERAFADWPASRTGSFLIGDQETDLAAARTAGIPGYRFSGADLDAFVQQVLHEKRSLRVGELGA